MRKVYCTYCWQMHLVRSLDQWIADRHEGHGSDRSRYLFSREDYREYLRRYLARGQKHETAQIRLF